VEDDYFESGFATRRAQFYHVTRGSRRSARLVVKAVFRLESLIKFLHRSDRQTFDPFCCVASDSTIA